MGEQDKMLKPTKLFSYKHKIFYTYWMTKLNQAKNYVFLCNSFFVVYESNRVNKFSIQHLK